MVHPPIHPQSIFGYECVIRLEIVKVEKFTEYSKIPGKVKNVLIGKLILFAICLDTPIQSYFKLMR